MQTAKYRSNKKGSLRLKQAMKHRNKIAESFFFLWNL